MSISREESIALRAEQVERIAKEIQEIAGEKTQVGLEVNQAAPPKIEPPAVPYLLVGKAQCEPGKVCEVKVHGHTLAPVTGFGLAIGRPENLGFENWSVADDVKLLIGEKSPSHYQEDGLHGGHGYNPGNYLSIYCGFFRAIADVNDDSARPIHEVILPPMTHLATLVLKVDPATPPGTTIDLLNRDNWFGRPMGAGMIKRLFIRNHYTTSSVVAQYGICPNLVSGYVEVV